MRATVFQGPWDVRVESVPDPVLRASSDAIVRVSYAGICGSDLWRYRGVSAVEPGFRAGHEFVGVVEAVGKDVRSVRPDDLVVAPFAFCDGTCRNCLAGVNTSCENGGYWGGYDQDGGQGEAVRVPLADGTLVAVPSEAAGDERLMASVLTLADVMSTGHHGARMAGVDQGSTVAVVGDGAVGLCAVLAARRLGAERVTMLGRHEGRLALAARFGATEVLDTGEAPVDGLRELLAGGADAVIECVGNQVALDTAVGAARPGGTVGSVGVPNGVQGVDLGPLFGDNIGLRAGVCPARAYIPELLADVLAGTLDPSPVFDLQVGLDDVPAGYEAMHRREAIKVLVRP